MCISLVRLTAFAAGTMLATAGVVTAPASASTTAVTLSAPTSIKQGRSATLTATVTVDGVPAAGVTVTLLGRSALPSYSTQATATTSSSGTVGFTVRPTRTTRYAVSYAEMMSTSRLLTVHPLVFADRVAGTATSTRQLITVRASGSWGSRNATLYLWNRRSDSSWQLARTVKARLGSGGLARGTTRRQNTNTTPSGNWPISFGFGFGSAAGWKISYRHITKKSWWCEQSGNRYYNRWVEQNPLKACDPYWAEHLASYPVYRRAVLIPYNWSQRRGRGAGIFLHENGRSYTGGCVSIPAHDMYVVSRWLDRRRSPRLAISAVDGLLT